MQKKKILCGPEGKGKLTRDIENLDVCRREVKHGIRDPDPDDFATEKEYDCCTITDDIVWTEDCGSNRQGFGYKKMYNTDKCAQSIGTIVRDVKPGRPLAQLLTTEGAETMKRGLDAVRDPRRAEQISYRYSDLYNSGKKTADPNYEWGGAGIKCQSGSGNTFERFWR